MGIAEITGSAKYPMQTDFKRWMRIAETAGGDSRLLFHGTSIINAASIMARKYLKSDASHGDRLGVSFTRSERLGWDFASIAEARECQFDYDRKPHGRPSMKGALLTFDAHKMRTALGKRLAPYVWNERDGVDDEEEERFHGDGLDIASIVQSVRAAPQDITWWAHTIPELTNTYQAAFAKSVAALAHNPMFRPI